MQPTIPNGVCSTSAGRIRCHSWKGRLPYSSRPAPGKIDQGGGVIWRVQDCNNYYISRYNPLEGNVSIYHVKDGQRIMLAYSGKLQLTDAWHVLKISHTGTRIQASIDGEVKLMANAGDYIPQKGGVGLWTKADAATAFDSFTVIPK